MFGKKKIVYVHRPGGQSRSLVSSARLQTGSSDPLPVSHAWRWAPWILCFIITAALGTGVWYHFSVLDEHHDKLQIQRASLEQEKRVLQAAIDRTKRSPTFNEIQPQAMSDLFKALTLSQVSAPDQKPPITGDEAADAYIRGVAEARGYSFWPVSDGKVMAAIDGYTLQEPAALAWLQLRSAAERDGIRLELVSAFRDYAEQTSLFRQQSNLGAYTPAQITGRQADDAIEKALEKVSPPGYSRHHTGYTIDVRDGLGGGAKFATTRAFAWLSQNNYQRAKQFGWLPSYPEGATSVGPNPESWEYVYVGIEALRAD